MFSVTPPISGNVTIAGNPQQRVHARYHHSVAGHWSLDIDKADIELLYQFSSVEITFIAEQLIYSCHAQVGAINAAGGSVLLSEIEPISSRPLRSQERVAVDLSCAVIMRDGDKSTKHYLDSGKNVIANISESGALLSTREPLAMGQGLLLLFSLLEGDNEEGRVYMSGKVVREQRGVSNGFQHHYGVEFGHLCPAYFQLLKDFIQHQQRSQRLRAA